MIIAGMVTTQYSPQTGHVMTRNQVKSMNGIAGMIMAAAISEQILQLWPRTLIHATIGTVMKNAMNIRRRVGRRAPASSNVPVAPAAAQKAMPPISMPITIARNISKK